VRPGFPYSDEQIDEWAAIEQADLDRRDAKAWVLVVGDEVKRAYRDFDRAVEQVELARKRAEQAKAHLDRVHTVFEQVAYLSAAKLDRPETIQ
jgi:gluconate kinase